MIYLTWGMKDPRAVYGNPNLRWGSPSYLLEPGDEGYVELQPGDPGYVPPAPKPPRRRKPLGRIPASHAESQPTPTPATMPDSFHYNVGPTTGSRWRPRADIQGKQTAEQHAEAVVARCAAAGITITAAQATAVITASDEETIDQARRTWRVDYPGGYSQMQPTAGSSHADPNFEGTYDNLTPDAARSLTRKGRLRFATGFVSTLGEIAPEKGATITRVLNLANGAENQYKIGKGQLVEGTDLSGIGAEFPGTQIVYIADDGTETTVPLDTIVQKDPSRLSWIVPAGLSGEQMLKLVVFLNGGLRTTIHTANLTAAP